MNHDLATAAEVLSQSPFFTALSDRARTELVSQAVELRLIAGQHLFAKGDPGEELYLLLEGEVEVGLLLPDGRQARFASLKSGTLLGEIAAIDGGPRSADVFALCRSRLLAFNRKSILQALRSEPDALLALTRELCTRIRRANDELESGILLDLPAKAARFLLEESDHGRRVIQLTQGEVARRIGVSREKFNRTLSIWREKGFVDVTRTDIKVVAPDELAHISLRHLAN